MASANWYTTLLGFWIYIHFPSSSHSVPSSGTVDKSDAGLTGVEISVINSWPWWVFWYSFSAARRDVYCPIVMGRLGRRVAPLLIVNHRESSERWNDRSLSIAVCVSYIVACDLRADWHDDSHGLHTHKENHTADLSLYLFLLNSLRHPPTNSILLPPFLIWC